MSITRVDAAVLQLRAQLQRLARERRERASPVPVGEDRPLERLRRPDTPGGDADQDFRRRFVRALLTEELGEKIAGGPEFERISNEVWRLLDVDEETRALMDLSLAQLG